MLKIGIIGTGNMAVRHAKSLLALADRVEIVGVCGTSEAKARVFADTWGLKRAGAFGDMETFLSAVAMDGVVITLPPFAHSGQVEAVASRGLGVFVEKPIALTRERAHSMASAVERSGVVSLVGYNNHTSSLVRRLQVLIGSGDAGRVTLFQGRYFCNALHHAWWRDPERSGGQFLEQVIHISNLAHTFCGKPRAASGLLANLCHRDVADYLVEDTGVAQVFYESGAMASLCHSNCAVPMRWVGQFTLVCERLVAEVTCGEGARVTFTGGDALRVEEWKDESISMMAHFVDVLAGVESSRVTIPDAVRDLEVALAVSDSSAAGGVLQILNQPRAK